MPHALWLHPSHGDDAVASNNGFMSAGFAAREGEKLRLSLWATTRGFGGNNGSLTATLLDGHKAIGSVELVPAGRA